MSRNIPIEHAPYLQALAEQWMQHDTIKTLKDEPEGLQKFIDTFNVCPQQIIEDSSQLLRFLREQKQQFTLLWALQYFAGIVDQQTAGRRQSEFAAATIALAYKGASACPEFKQFRDAERQIIPGVFILGLGKLGGFDLNFSSDIDLVAFYDDDLCSIDKRLGRTHVVTKLLSKATHFLNHKINNEFVWRVDWRLRPNASVKYLSMPVHQAINFYHFQALPWHRLAMIKARIVGGDQHAGELFLDSLQNYLWKRNLDFRTIDEIASLKQRINAEHPRLQNQRGLEKTTGLQKIEGFNFKLGHGGIREIEFFVNAMQLIWGGKKHSLRTAHTLTALQALATEDIINHALAEDLKTAYLFLRRAEDALQMLNNQQTHTTPQDAGKRTAWLTLLNTDENTFNTELTHCRHLVHQEFNALFNEDEPEASAPPAVDWEAFIARLDARGQSIVSDWQQGFLVYGALPSQANQLIPLATELARIVCSAELEPSDAVLKIDSYLRQLPGGGQYLALLHKHPGLLEKLIKPLLLSRAMSILLEQSPHIIDCFLEAPRHDHAAQIDRDYILREQDHEQALERLRRMTNEELYRLYLLYLENTINCQQLEHYLTLQAEQTLQLALDLTHAHLKLAPSSFSIIGLGKLGMRQLMPRSDLDLMYLFDEDIEVQRANKIASHLNTVLHLRMREGRVYELDTRLRPSGRSGSPTISLKSFHHYHCQQAYNWEHLALFPARFICGQQGTGERFNAIRKTVLARPRNLQQWRYDGFKMFQRIKEQRLDKAQSERFASKLRAGGLMQTEYLFACFAVETAVEKPQLLETDYLSSLEFISTLKDADFSDTLSFWHNFQVAVRIFGYEDRDLDALPGPIIDSLNHKLKVNNLQELREKIEHHSDKIIALTRDYFKEVDASQMGDWQESSVDWLDEKTGS